MKKIPSLLLTVALTAIPITSSAFFGFMNPWNWGGPGWGGWDYPYYGYGYPGWGAPYYGGYGYPGWGAYPYALPYAPVYAVPTTPTSQAK